MSGLGISDAVIDKFVDISSDELTLVLMKLIAHPSQGGHGYRLAFFDPTIDMDGWEVDTCGKRILLDSNSIWGRHTARESAEHLRNAIQTSFLKSRASLFSRVSWGLGKVTIGVIETGVGLVGILVPEPGTTVAGVGMVVLGANSLGDGISQLAGAKQGNGYNVLGEAFGHIGGAIADVADLDPEVGRKAGKGVFAVSSLAFGSVGSIRLLNIKSISSVRLGVGGQPGGFEVGRLAMGYASNRARDGMTIFNISDNSGRWILRVVTHGGKLVVNGRIVGTQKLLKHEGNWRAVAKGVLKLLAHGAKNGM